MSERETVIVHEVDVLHAMLFELSKVRDLGDDITRIVDVARVLAQVLYPADPVSRDNLVNGTLRKIYGGGAPLIKRAVTV